MTESFICRFCKQQRKNANALRNHERLCKQNPNRQLTTYEKYGSIPKFNDKGRSAWNKGLSKETNDSLAKLSAIMKQRVLDGTMVMPKPMDDPVVREKHKASMKAAYANYSRRTPGKCKTGYYDGIWCDSSWELAYLLYCKLHGIRVRRNKDGFNYLWQEETHKYFPDFYLEDTGEYVEVKGYLSDRDQQKLLQFSGKLLVVGAKEMQPILAEVIQVYGKDFFNLYETTTPTI